MANGGFERSLLACPTRYSLLATRYSLFAIRYLQSRRQQQQHDRFVLVVQRNAAGLRLRRSGGGRDRGRAAQRVVERLAGGQRALRIGEQPDVGRLGVAPVLRVPRRPSRGLRRGGGLARGLAFALARE